MEIREFNRNADYAVIEEWQNEHKVSPTPLYILPPTGFMAFDESEDIAAAFVCFSDNNCATLARVISNPAAKPEKKSVASDILFEACLDAIAKKGFRFVGLATSHPKILKKCLREGFQIFEENLTLLGKVI